STYNYILSSRRRHTRSKRDWSSDVCSSDLMEQMGDVNVYHESVVLLTRIGMRWAGVTAPEEEIERIAEDMDIMIDSFKGLGNAIKGYKASKDARRRVED